VAVAIALTAGADRRRHRPSRHRRPKLGHRDRRHRRDDRRRRPPSERLTRPYTFTIVEQNGWKVCHATITQQ
jgi:hypothetical protein